MTGLAGRTKMFTVIYLCTQCPQGKWYDYVDGHGRAREFHEFHVACGAANTIASLRRTVARVVDDSGAVVGQTPDFRKAR